MLLTGWPVARSGDTATGGSFGSNIRFSVGLVALGIEKTDRHVPLMLGRLLAEGHLIVTKGKIISGMDTTFKYLRR